MSLVVGLASLALPFTASLAQAACSMKGSQPDSGTLTLQYIKPSTKNSDRNDYRLSGTIRWNSSDALSCFDDGWIDWAYEHNITYQKHFDRKIWSPDFSAFPASSSPYIDTTASDNFVDRTDLTFGLFRPEVLSAGKTYSFSYSLFLPKKPPKGYHSFNLTGQVLERNCSKAGPWCVNIRPKAQSHGEEFIETKQRFEVTGTTCWAWQKGKLPPTLCPSPAPAPSPPPGATPPAPGGSPAPGGPPPAPQTWPEQQGSLGANTFTNPYNASGMGVKIQPYQWVAVSCKVYAPQIVSANPDGYWYRIASAPWNNAYYAVANTFWNGDIPGQKPYVHNTDFAVPNC
jgi:hypothetical protein